MENSPTKFCDQRVSFCSSEKRLTFVSSGRVASVPGTAEDSSNRTADVNRDNARIVAIFIQSRFWKRGERIYEDVNLTVTQLKSRDID